ncbi:MAG: lytic transglycosylase domain-containing protein [Rhizobiaceae bacterium]
MMRLKQTWSWIVLFSVLAGASWAETGVAVDDGDESQPVEKTVCELIDEAAAEHKLPAAFLTRLIWKESSFRPQVVSPKGAQGIAQFMPATASRRGLADPFDPSEAIPASADYLKDLAVRFGNLGLAAAAYNAGERRVSDWIVGTRRLPLETRTYVRFITGRAAADWKQAETPAHALAEVEDASDCAQVAALLSRPGAGSGRIVLRHHAGADWAPWGVQVAGNFSQSRALASDEARRQKHATLLGGQEPLMVSAVLRSRGAAPFHQVRIPFQTRVDADNLCGQLRKAGGACFVIKNKRRR